MIFLVRALALACALGLPGAARAQDARQDLRRPPDVPSATALPRSAPARDEMPRTTAPKSAAPRLAGTLPEPAWRAFRSRFVTERGRVIDTANGAISHSEGQGYGMLLAVAGGDRAGFERMWGWTRANLMVRGDALLAWRWAPHKRPAVADMNNASDGDLLVAWALTEAAEAWAEPAYRTAGRRIAVEVGRKAMLFKDPHGPLVLPAASGFSAADRRDGPLVNLSYWVFPAFQRLGIVAPEYDWDGLLRSGIALLRAAQFGPARLPSEWISMKAAPQPAEGFPALFSYNAIRVPLYLAWAGLGLPDDYAPFITAREGISVVDTGSGRVAERLTERGYAALPALAACAAGGKPLPDDFETVHEGENYYPTTLHLLATIAARMRYPSCLRR